MSRQVPISDIKDAYRPGPGAHWFDKDTGSFFRTRLPQYGLYGADGIYFVTSEQPPEGERAYTVRRLVGPGKIVTVGPFCELTKRAAQALARRCAAVGYVQALEEFGRGQG